ncbi:MAG: tRNA-queuosine alpha-mannosyltransferase domain-containing protein [Ilumatobacteraceae bacterium]
MTERTLRVALVEQYLGGSHRVWAEGYAHHSRHDVRLFSLPATHWKWRMQGGHVGIARAVVDSSTTDGPFDVLVASSMTDVAGLAGLGRRVLAGTPIVFYVHENQLTYPRQPGEVEDLTYAMTNWTSMLASDVVVFNSEFHRSDWFAAVPGFLRRLPDQRHDALIGEVERRSCVLPVGVDLAPILRAEPRSRTDSRRPLVLWNQRWEFDKGPDDFVAAIERLVADGIDVDVALAGERPRQAPPALLRLRELLGERVVHDGFADVTEYHDLLRRADIVVSTAHHEFFGVALTEAVAAGAFPVVPARVVYPERIPPDLHRVCLYRDVDGLVDLLRRAILDPDGRRDVVDRLRPVMARFDWSVVAPSYDDLLVRVVDGVRPPLKVL